MPYFTYDNTATNYLKSKDVRLGKAIETIGTIKRATIPDLFEAMMYTIVGQQISLKAHLNIWEKIKIISPDITPQNISVCPTDTLRQVGLPLRKVSYMQEIAQKIMDKALNLNTLKEMNDQQVRSTLCQLRGIGEWSAEMLMIFSMQRPNILSFGDFAIRRGLRMLYHHREITPQLWAKYHKRYTPYASVASLYLWEIASGKIPTMKDYAPLKKNK